MFYRTTRTLGGVIEIFLTSYEIRLNLIIKGPVQIRALLGTISNRALLGN